MSFIGSEVGIKALSSFDTAQTSVGTTAIQLATAGTDRKVVAVKTDPDNAAKIWIGNDALVTTNTGYVLAAGDAVEIDLVEGAEIWAIAAGGTQNVTILEAYK